MPAYRDHPRRGAALAAELTYLTGAAVSAGTVGAFLLIVVVAIAGEEVFGSIYSGFDAIFRAAVGFVSVTFVVALGVTGYGLAASRVAGARQLALEAAEQPDHVATWRDRRDLETQTPFTFAYNYSGWMFGLGMLTLLIMALALQETFRYNPESAKEGLAVAIGVGTFVAVCGLLAVGIRFVAVPRWQSDVASVHAIWDIRARAAATEVERARRSGQERADFGRLVPALRGFARVVSRAAIVAGVVGVILFFIDVVIRQPCRGCSQIFYDRPVESIIDVVMLVAAPLILLSVVAGAVALIARWAATISERLTLIRLADTGARSPRPAQLLPTLTQDGPLENLGLALIGLAGGGLPVAIATFVVTGASDARLASFAIGAGVALGIVILAAGIAATGRLRNRLREVWSPGDPVPPRPDARRKTAPVRDAGD